MFVFILYTENKHCLIIRVYTVTYCTCVPLTQKKNKEGGEREREGERWEGELGEEKRGRELERGEGKLYY